ncbi:MAG: sigma 54-interacting transcriptional regulator [Acidobacteriota bacterium]|nr:sigma 54-interacting transcriptional regulator [Acidobacteriota bacterium]
MAKPFSFDSINELVSGKRPLEDTLNTIVSQLCARDSIALARIWLIESFESFKESSASTETPETNLYLRLTASRGLSSAKKTAWTGRDGRFKRIAVGVRKVGFVAETGESVLLNGIEIQNSPWIVDKEWIEREKIVAFAAHPLKFKDDILGVLAVFSRAEISLENFEWLKFYADQAALAIANARAFEELEKLRQKLEDENSYLKEVVSEQSRYEFLVGKSPVWQKIIRQIEMVADTDTTVLITGESGTGKELVARAIHESSSRKDQPMVRVNCAAISPELFESEFFGHVRGAFTSAIKDRAGRFQIADGGTIFLDEIGELPLALQGKLLRVLQEKQFERVGDDRTITVDVRVIAATNHNLEQEVKQGSFRQDLFYRLTVFPIHLPPLRERVEDIEPLARHFLKQLLAESHLKPMTLGKKDIEILQNYSFPGNVRELQNIIERAAIMNNSPHGNFSISDLFDNANARETAESKEKDAGESIKTYDELKELERENLLKALEAADYRIYGSKGASELLKIKPTTLISKIKAMKIPMRPARNYAAE